MKSKILALAAAALLSLASADASAQVVLRFSNWLPTTHGLYPAVWQKWQSDVERVTEGRVKVQFLPKVVGTVPTQLDVVRDGLADVGYIIQGYSPGRFTLQGVAELPFLGNSAKSNAIAYWRIFNKHLKGYNEHEGVVPVVVWAHGPGMLWWNKGVLKNLADLKGAKLRTPGATTIPVVEALGATPLQKPLTEIYELVSTGIVDGTLLSREPAQAFNLLESLKYLTEVEGGLYTASQAIIVNEGKWKSINAKDQEAIMKVSGESMAAEIARVTDELDQKAVNRMKELKLTVEKASPEVMQQLKTALAPVEQNWIKAAKAKGMKNPEEVLADLRAEIAKIEAGTN
jgi:TRAP-type C4-dicarboxylate transport system substrate-binding protein